jgi:hypothetical protein
MWSLKLNCRQSSSTDHLFDVFHLGPTGSRPPTSLVVVQDFGGGDFANTCAEGW